MFNLILYGASGFLLLWMGFRWSKQTFFEMCIKFLYLLTGQINLLLMFKELGLL